ncbi:hypothetical protein [Catenuloplanes indicus]|uniref:Uncharacterized protein n=1 Tax=Catenuloplanes indicus TaxID=137267 RepID=A0AAE3VWF6_9ACTN|nr:hypothetical protein [Catenuloplanes indicus]MDQ0364940.1 hypothetical protein [Catenuloplanes indicus]
MIGQEESLREDETLADAELTAPDGRGDGGPRPVVRCGRPLLYPVPAGELPVPLRRRARSTGAAYLGALFAFDLGDLPAGHRYAAARLTVDLGDSPVIAVAVHADGGQFGLGDDDTAPLAGRTRAATADRPGLLPRLGTRTGRPRAHTSGVHSARFGWGYTDRRTAPILPRGYGCHALLEIPPDVTSLHGTLSVQADVKGLVLRRMSTREAVPFTAPVPRTPPGPHHASVRLCMAADVAGYSTRRTGETARIQHDLVRLLAAARTTAGIGEDQVAPQPQGDGQFTVLPSGIDEADVIPRLVRGVAAELAARNAAAPAVERIRLRMALHRGLVREADNGWVGRAAIAVHRILDAPPLRAALADHPDADFALGVPDALFLDAVADGAGPPDPAAFRRITVDLPTKGFQEQAWIYVQ